MNFLLNDHGNSFLPSIEHNQTEWETTVWELLYILLLTVDQFHQWFQIESYQHCPWELLRMGIPHLCNWSQFKYPILVIELSPFLSISLSLSFVALFLLYVFLLSPYKDPLWTELWETVKGGTAQWNGTSHLSSSEQYDQQQKSKFSCKIFKFSGLLLLLYSSFQGQRVIWNLEAALNTGTSMYPASSDFPSPKKRVLPSPAVCQSLASLEINYFHYER